MPSHHEGEEVALKALLVFLRANGHSVSVECSPDEVLGCHWKNDWVLLIDGERWLIEHTALSYCHRSKPRMEQADHELRAFLDLEGRKHSVRIIALASPKIDGTASDRKVARKQRARSYEELKVFISGSLESITSWDGRKSMIFDDGLGNFIHVLFLDPDEDHEKIGYGFTGSTMASTPNLRDQFDKDIGPTIRRKLEKQIVKSPGIIEKAGLILDQHDTQAEVSNMLLSPEGVKQALVDLCEDFPNSLDCAWIYTLNGEFIDLDLTAVVPPIEVDSKHLSGK
jgi:hypothetical protein